MLVGGLVVSAFGETAGVVAGAVVVVVAFGGAEAGGVLAGAALELRKAAPAVDFRAVNDRASCKFMKMITPAALLRCLVEGADEVHVDPEIAAAGRRSVRRMIEIGQPGGGE